MTTTIVEMPEKTTVQKILRVRRKLAAVRAELRALAAECQTQNQLLLLTHAFGGNHQANGLTNAQCWALVGLNPAEFWGHYNRVPDTRRPGESMFDWPEWKELITIENQFAPWPDDEEDEAA
jgi:hypothetical protein